MDAEAIREYVRRWQRAAPALEAVRWSELAALDDGRALEAADALIEAALTVPLPAERQTSSGLVEQQARFARLRP